MKRLHDLLPAPASMVPRLSRDAAEKTWTCPACGVVPPIAFADGWYARRLCRCERAAFAAKTFASFRRERQLEAFALAQAFAARPEGNLALYGSYGTGKTHLLAAIANAVTSVGLTCRFASVVSLFDALQERIQLGQDYHELVRRATGAPLLVLDDLDKLKPSEFREETLYKLLNGRNTAGLPLALSANSAPDEMARWIGAAGRSRLRDRLIPVPMNGPDYRLEVNT